ncbi:MAG: hypothetical protein ACREKL_07080 [Chthoniobacterales bacterium]
MKPVIFLVLLAAVLAPLRAATTYVLDGSVPATMNDGSSSNIYRYVLGAKVGRRTA